jgi:preprotein translocase subunit Sss1
VFTFDGKKIGKKSLSSYNSEKERALTVGELIQARKEDPTMTFDNSMMATIANTASQEQIYSHIADVVAKIGNSESTTEAYANISTMLQNRLAKKPTQEEWQAVQEIAAIAE